MRRDCKNNRPGAAGDVIAGALIVAHADERDGVEAPDAAAVEPVAGVVLPDEAGGGDAPSRAANAASERTRPGCDQASRTVAATTAPTPGRASSRRRLCGDGRVGK